MNECIKQDIRLKGFFRLNIVEHKNGEPEIVGDSGWVENQVTNLGVSDFLVELLGKQANSKQINYVALGTGGAPAAADSILGGEIMGSTKRTAVTASNVGSFTQRFTATFASANSFFTGATSSAISNIGLYGTNTGSNLFAGNTYTSSALNSNQDVNVTYEIRFTTS